jgi:hypothetical protein
MGVRLRRLIGNSCPCVPTALPRVLNAEASRTTAAAKNKAQGKKHKAGGRGVQKEGAAGGRGARTGRGGRSNKNNNIIQYK